MGIDAGDSDGGGLRAGKRRGQSDRWSGVPARRPADERPALSTVKRGSSPALTDERGQQWSSAPVVVLLLSWSWTRIEEGQK